MNSPIDVLNSIHRLATDRPCCRHTELDDESGWCEHCQGCPYCVGHRKPMKRSDPATRRTDRWLGRLYEAFTSPCVLFWTICIVSMVWGLIIRMA